MKSTKSNQKVHIALAVADLDASIVDYTERLGVQPCWISINKYSLFRIDSLNLSITVNKEKVGQVRHIGFEDDSVTSFTEETDVNGLVWERFNKKLQEDAILEFYPDAKCVNISNSI